MFDKSTLQNLADKSGGVQNSLLYITSDVNSTMRRCFLTYRPRTECSGYSQFCKTNCSHSIFRTIEARTINYRIDHIIKRFHEENSLMSGLFSQNNLLFCGMEGKNGLSAYTASPFSLLTSAKFAVRAVSVWMNITRVTLHHNKEFTIMFIFYLRFYYV